MCNCIEEIKKLVLDNFNENYNFPHGLAEKTEIDLPNESLILKGSKAVKALLVPSIITYRENKKDGTPKQHKSSREISLQCDYCPFCGEKIGEEKKDEITNK